MYQILPICATSLLKSNYLRDVVPLVMVVSPLIALMQDQVEKLNSKAGLHDDSGIVCSAVCLSDSTAVFSEGTTHLLALLGSKTTFLLRRVHMAACGIRNHVCSCVNGASLRVVRCG